MKARQRLVIELAQRETKRVLGFKPQAEALMQEHVFIGNLKELNAVSATCGLEWS